VSGWRSKRTIETAVELVSAALVFAKHEHAKEAAAFLVDPRTTATAQAKALAARVLSDRVQVIDDSVQYDVGLIRIRIHCLRLQLHSDPRNAIAWADLARDFIALGQRKQSLRSMENALRLAGGNRFVLRSAARLLVHLDDPERAHDLLRRCVQTPFDPWLLAAEIAVGCVAGVTSRWIKRGRAHLHSETFSPLHVSELASAIATMELRNGRLGAARKLFQQSLVQPTDNSVAQAAFVAEHIPQLEVGARVLRIPRSFEARALSSTMKGDWPDAVAECQRWLEDEPFWTRPASHGSYIAEVVLQDYPLAEQFARRGLAANPADPGLLNNLVVALAYQNRLEEADRTFASIHTDVRTANNRLGIVLTATEGLLDFRRGRHNAGRSRYEEAIRQAERGGVLGSQHLATLARLHLAREELVANTTKAMSALKAGADALRNRHELDLAAFWKSIEKLLPHAAEAPPE
jgi:tetratricopeptide (TPR) repeat protein